LKIPGIFFQKEFKRFYPAADITANLVGFTNLDNIGQEGIELSQNKFLSGKLGSKKVIKDRAGKIVDDLQEVKLPQDGHDIKLSIDARIQYLTYRELAKSIEIHKAKAGSAIVLDAKTGEVLAMANLPSYNPNNFREGGGPTRNRAVTDVFEPGSTIKPFTVSSALDAGILNPSSLVEISSGLMKIGSATIHDAHADGSKPFMTVSEVIAKSSNVGAARIGLMQTPKSLWSTLNKVGFGMQTSAGFPGEASGRLRDYKNWGKVDQATISFGHGLI
jgi:cell division protein FtsI (penicillin-binding protein 3)